MADNVHEPVGIWPDPDMPGTPLEPLRHGIYLLRWPHTRQLTVAQWAPFSHAGDDEPDAGMWVVSYLGTLCGPKELAHLDYVCEMHPPVEAMEEADAWQRRAATIRTLAIPPNRPL